MEATLESVLCDPYEQITSKFCQHCWQNCKLLAFSDLNQYKQRYQTLLIASIPSIKAVFLVPKEY